MTKTDQVPILLPRAALNLSDAKKLKKKVPSKLTLEIIQFIQYLNQMDSLGILTKTPILDHNRINWIIFKVHMEFGQKKSIFLVSDKIIADLECGIGTCLVFCHSFS